MVGCILDESVEIFLIQVEFFHCKLIQPVRAVAVRDRFDELVLLESSSDFWELRTSLSRTL